MRIRKDLASNYRAVFLNSGKTIRMRIDSNLPILSPSTPEIEDVAINSLCYANCSYCYTSATKAGNNFTNIVDKANEVWGSLALEDRPFQIAIGGAGESTLHPDWVSFVSRVKELGIVPNYTTNGMHLTDEILKATEDYCGGVALSYHPHLKTFDESLLKLASINTRLNLHIIIGDDKSLFDMQKLYDKYHDKVEYFVVLPYQAAGRATPIETADTWKKTFDYISKVDSSKFAFGALFYNFLLENEIPLEMSIYEPEIYSGYRLLDNSYKVLRNSSYDLTEKSSRILTH